MVAVLVIKADVGVSSVDVSQRSVRIDLALTDFEEATGWVLNSTDLCKGDICYPVRNVDELSDGVNIDLVVFAKFANQSLVFDREYEVAALGELVPAGAKSTSILDSKLYFVSCICG